MKKCLIILELTEYFKDRPEQEIQDFQSELMGLLEPIRPGADVVEYSYCY
jgi:hypothetical protein